MLANGANTAARGEIYPAFEFGGMDLTQINEGFLALRKDLNLTRPAAGVEDSRDDSGVVMADSLWLKRGYFEKQFLKTSGEYYGIDLKRWLSVPTADSQVSCCS